MSAHGDQADLLRWYERIEGRPPVHLVHGDPEAAETLRARLAEMGASSSVADMGQKIEL
jgi:metallo-beta-lactamase family protein